MRDIVYAGYGDLWPRRPEAARVLVINDMRTVLQLRFPSSALTIHALLVGVEKRLEGHGARSTR